MRSSGQRNILGILRDSVCAEKRSLRSRSPKGVVKSIGWLVPAPKADARTLAGSTTQQSFWYTSKCRKRSWATGSHRPSQAETWWGPEKYIERIPSQSSDSAWTMVNRRSQSWRTRKLGVASCEWFPPEAGHLPRSHRSAGIVLCCYDDDSCLLGRMSWEVKQKRRVLIP